MPTPQPVCQVNSDLWPPVQGVSGYRILKNDFLIHCSGSALGPCCLPKATEAGSSPTRRVGEIKLSIPHSPAWSFTALNYPAHTPFTINYWCSQTQVIGENCVFSFFQMKGKNVSKPLTTKTSQHWMAARSKDFYVGVFYINVVKCCVCTRFYVLLTLVECILVKSAKKVITIMIIIV